MFCRYARVRASVRTRMYAHDRIMAGSFYERRARNLDSPWEKRSGARIKMFVCLMGARLVVEGCKVGERFLFIGNEFLRALHQVLSLYIYFQIAQVDR